VAGALHGSPAKFILKEEVCKRQKLGLVPRRNIEALSED